MDSAADRRTRLLRTAQQAKEIHEQVAATLDRLAEQGGEHAEHRRALAEQARANAATEARHIADLQRVLDREVDTRDPGDTRGPGE